MTILSHSPAETVALGKTWGSTLTAGSILGLEGELGAGKTELVRGVAQGLGYSGQVHSPTFNLISEYWGGRLPLFHLDLYRLSSAADWLSAGLDEYLERMDGVAVIEWVGRLPPDRQASLRANRSYRHVELVDEGELKRRITCEDSGS